MNPPFSAAVQHVKHALGFLADDGTLIAVMPESVMWHSDRATVEFRELVALAEGSYPAARRVVRALRDQRPHRPPGRRRRAWRPLPTHGWHQRQPRQLDLFAAA